MFLFLSLSSYFPTELILLHFSVIFEILHCEEGCMPEKSWVSFRTDLPSLKIIFPHSRMSSMVPTVTQVIFCWIFISLCRWVQDRIWQVALEVCNAQVFNENFHLPWLSLLNSSGQLAIWGGGGINCFLEDATYLFPTLHKPPGNSYTMWWELLFLLATSWQILKYYKKVTKRCETHILNMIRKKCWRN